MSDHALTFKHDFYTNFAASETIIYDVELMMHANCTKMAITNKTV